MTHPGPESIDRPPESPNDRGRWADWLELGIDPSAITADEMRRVRILVIASVAMVLIAVPYMVNHWFTGVTSICVALGLATTAAVANLGLLRWMLRPIVCGHLAIAILTGVLTFSAYNTGGFYDPNFSWLYLVPVCAVVILDHRGASAWALVTLGIAGVFWVLPEIGVEVVNRVPEEMQPSQALLNRMSAIVAICLIAASFVTGQRRAEHELATANADLSRETAYVQLLQHATEAANEATSFAEAMQHSVERICATMNWAVGHVSIVRDDGTIVSSGFSHSPDPDRFAPLQRLTEVASYQRGQGLPGRAFASQAPECILDLELAPDLGPRGHVAREAGLRSAFAVPILVNGRVRAVLEFADIEPLSTDDRLTEVFSHVGFQLGRMAERTTLHERLRQSQKMEAVGQLAAGLAHEINNPMSYVRSNLRLLQELWQKLGAGLQNDASDEDIQRSSEISECEELVEEALDGVERTIAIVRDVREFSHFSGGSRISWSLVDLSDLIEGALRVALPQTPPDVRFERDYAERAWIRCSPNQLRQVFVNLIVNSVQAVGTSGAVRLSTGIDGDFVVARIADDGPGMSAETLERLFDPFYTTKPVGEGTGLGLYVSYEIVQGHDGEIAVRSELGEGSVFEVRFPMDAEGATERPLT